MAKILNFGQGGVWGGMGGVNSGGRGVWGVSGGIFKFPPMVVGFGRKPFMVLPAGSRGQSQILSSETRRLRICDTIIPENDGTAADP